MSAPVALPRRSVEARALGSLPDPYPVYRELRRHSPVHRLDEAHAVVLVSRYDDVRSLLLSPEVFSSSPQAGLEAVLAGADPPLHTRVRRSLFRDFTKSRVEAWEPRIRQRARERIAALLAQRGPVDLMAGFAAPLAVHTLREMLQVEERLAERFESWVDALALYVDAVPQRQTPELFGSITEMLQFMAREHFPRCAEPSAAGVISGVARGEALEGAPLDLEGKLGLMRLFLFAGVETARALLGNCVLTFLRNPPSWEGLRARRERLPRAIEEVVRFESPIQVIHRVAVRDTRIAGCAVPRGMRILALLGSANRDEQHFAEPDRFWVERPDPHHLGFGIGIHFCLGSHLARLQARVGLEELLERCPRLRAAEPLETVPIAGRFTTRGPERLRVDLS